MSKRERKETPESELTEEQVRTGFNNLRTLYKESQAHVHELKVRQKELNVKIRDLEHTVANLKREIKKNQNQKTKKVETPKKKKNDEVKIYVSEGFKKRFLDSL